MLPRSGQKQTKPFYLCLAHTDGETEAPALSRHLPRVPKPGLMVIALSVPCLTHFLGLQVSQFTSLSGSYPTHSRSVRAPMTMMLRGVSTGVLRKSTANEKGSRDTVWCRGDRVYSGTGQRIKSDEDWEVKDPGLAEQEAPMEGSGQTGNQFRAQEGA